MAWLYWIAAAWLAVGITVTVAQVGKPRPPITGGVAATTVILSGGIVALLIIAALNA